MPIGFSYFPQKVAAGGCRMSQTGRGVRRRKPFQLPGDEHLATLL